MEQMSRNPNDRADTAAVDDDGDVRSGPGDDLVVVVVVVMTTASNSSQHTPIGATQACGPVDGMVTKAREAPASHRLTVWEGTARSTGKVRSAERTNT